VHKKEQRNEDRKDVRPILIRPFQNQTTKYQNEDLTEMNEKIK
jgi:hypothetical protein